MHGCHYVSTFTCESRTSGMSQPSRTAQLQHTSAQEINNHKASRKLCPCALTVGSMQGSTPAPELEFFEEIRLGWLRPCVKVDKDGQV